MAKRCDVGASVRVYLCGSVALECGAQVVRDGAFGGRQGRLVFAFLMLRAPHPVSRTELMAALWGDSPPPSADTALNAIISKLRRVLRDLGIVSTDGIVNDVGTYRLVLPSAFVDLEIARTAADRAEGALRTGDVRAAWANANVAVAIASEPFLSNESRPWVERQRAVLARVRRRALLVLSDISTRNGEHELAIQYAADVADSEPFDEVACQALMRAHASAGNRAEALRVYAKCRKLFRDELGAEPSEKTASVFLAILKSHT